MIEPRALATVLPSLRRYARALVGEPAAADDLVQDTLERAWTNAGRFRPDGDLRAWLFSIMHNLRIDGLRRAQPETLPIEELVTEPPQRAEQEDGLALRDLDAALACLPEEQRAVLLLVALEGLRYEEVAQVLRIPVGTVMSRLSRARERLRASLSEQDTPLSPTLRIVK